MVRNKSKKILEGLLSDIKPKSKRISINIEIEKVNRKDIESYCREKNDIGVYRKLRKHELFKEPMEHVIVLSRKGNRSISQQNIKKILRDLGYNFRVIFAKKRGSDYQAALSINGYSIPGWKIILSFSRKINRNIAKVLGKKFAPGNSRMHLRIYQGKNNWYIVAHIDHCNVSITNLNIIGMSISHLRSGKGDYKSGTEFFLKSLEYYFS